MLLFVMALMIIFGTAASWKIRTDTVARDSVWRTRWPRELNILPHSVGWPNTAATSSNAAPAMMPLDDLSIDHPVARGPMVGAVPVNRDLLDFSRGIRAGTADITRTPPILAKVGDYHLGAEDALIEDQFEYLRMGLSRNTQRRMPVIYPGLNVPPAPNNTYMAALNGIGNLQWRLRTLDHDDEFIAWYGSAPDFHPRMQSFCTLDVNMVLQDHILSPRTGIKEQIDHVPRRMANAFIAMYQSQLNTIPPPPPAVQNDLMNKIDQLQQFLASLP